MNKKTDPVHDAIQNSDVKALQQALAEGGDINKTDRRGRTPLANAVIDENRTIVETLVSKGADLNASDKQGFSPLHLSAQRQSIVLTKLLLAAGAQVDAKDTFGNTPLFRAVFESRGRPEVIKALLAAGADQLSLNESGVSPRDLARSIANFDVLSLQPVND